MYERPVMGLPVAGQHVWGALQVGGRRLLLIRHFMNEMAGRFLVYEAAIGEDMTYCRSKGYSGLCEIGEIDGQWGIYQPGSPPSFVFTTHGEEGRWVDGTADLTLRLHPTALQFVTPDSDEPLAYFARAFDVTGGTFDGQPVDAGVVMQEQVYLSSGRGWMLSRHKRELQGAWIAFANRYADGSFEFGSVCVGTRGWQFGVVIRSDGNHVLADRPAGGASSDGDTFDVELDFGADGTWRWRPPSEGGGRVPLPGPRETTPLWAEGIFQRDGDDRELVFAHTWAEVYPHHLDSAQTARRVHS
ncbi:MAG: hypothetical protein ACR2JI_08560 [Mycobacterium sp.]